MSGRIDGRVVSVTEAGNLVTDITDQQLRDSPRDERVSVKCDEHETNGIYAADHGQPDFTFIAQIGPTSHLELVIVGDSASAMLGIRVGEKVVVQWV